MKYVLFWNIFRREFFPTYDEETEDLMKEKERLKRIISERTQKSNSQFN